MTEYAVVTPDNTIERISSSITPDVPTRQGYRVLPVTRVSQEVGDGQVRGGTAIEITKDGVTITQLARDKTQEELDAEVADRKQGAVDNLGDAGVKMLLDHENRIRALEGRAPATEDDVKAAIQEKVEQGTRNIEADVKVTR